MADTVRSNFSDKECSDCAEKGHVYLCHWGPLVPPGKTGYFDRKCFMARVDDDRNGRPVRPLGEKTTHLVPEE